MIVDGPVCGTETELRKHSLRPTVKILFSISARRIVPEIRRSLEQIRSFAGEYDHDQGQSKHNASGGRSNQPILEERQ